MDNLSKRLLSAAKKQLGVPLKIVCVHRSFHHPHRQTCLLDIPKLNLYYTVCRGRKTQWVPGGDAGRSMRLSPPCMLFPRKKEDKPWKAHKKTILREFGWPCQLAQPATLLELVQLKSV